jgi:hypothetical protein
MKKLKIISAIVLALATIGTVMAIFNWSPKTDSRVIEPEPVEFGTLLAKDILVNSNNWEKVELPFPSYQYVFSTNKYVNKKCNLLITVESMSLGTFVYVQKGSQYCSLSDKESSLVKESLHDVFFKRDFQILKNSLDSASRVNDSLKINFRNSFNQCL